MVNWWKLDDPEYCRRCSILCVFSLSQIFFGNMAVDLYNNFVTSVSTSVSNIISFVTSDVRYCSRQYRKHRRNWSNAYILFCLPNAGGSSNAILVFFVVKRFLHHKRIKHLHKRYKSLPVSFKRLPQTATPLARCRYALLSFLRPRVFLRHSNFSFNAQ